MLKCQIMKTETASLYLGLPFHLPQSPLLLGKSKLINSAQTQTFTQPLTLHRHIYTVKHACPKIL